MMTLGFGHHDDTMTMRGWKAECMVLRKPRGEKHLEPSSAPTPQMPKPNPWSL